MAPSKFTSLASLILLLSQVTATPIFARDEGHGSTAISNTSVQIPNYRGKPSSRALEVETGKYFVKIQARKANSSSQDSYKFYYTTKGYPRFYNSYFNATRSKNSSEVVTWGYDMALLRIFEFEDSGDAGYDNETILSQIPFTGLGRNKGWSPIVYNTSTIENTTVYTFGSNITVNGTRIGISFAISSAQIRAALNSSTVLQPNSVKWDLSVTNYTFVSSKSSLAFESLVRSFDRVIRVTRNVTTRNDTEVRGNHTLPGNGTQLSINNGTGRIGFRNHIDVTDANGTQSNGTILISAPINDTRPDFLDQDQDADEKNSGDQENGNQAFRATGANRVRVFFTFVTSNGTQPTSFVWDPEVNVNDASDSSSLTGTDLSSVLSQSDAGTVLDTTTDTSTTTDPSPSPFANAKTSDASNRILPVLGRDYLLSIAVFICLGLLL